MESSEVNPQVMGLMVAGAVFALVGLWMMTRPKTDGHSAKLELFGMKFESSSAGLLVFLIGAGFLATPLWLPTMERGSDSVTQIERPGPGNDGDSNQSPPPPVDPTEWDPIGVETFSDNNTTWFTGETSSAGIATQEYYISSGDYRWELDFLESRTRVIDAPYGPARNLYLAVHIDFVSGFEDRSAAMGLVFGKSGEHEYNFLISTNGKYTLYSWDGSETVNLVGWTRLPPAVGDPDRLSVVIQEDIVKLYVNDYFVGDHKLIGYAGGKVGLGVTAWDAGRLIFDFDNFEYRRGPD